MPTISQIMYTAPVIPVITIEKFQHALPLARALLEGGLPVLEITLRTDCALEAIALIAQELPTAIVGAGTVINRGTYEKALAAGAQFIVSPGFTRDLLTCALEHKLPFLPGVNTPGEVMQLLEAGISAMKFFPAEAAGGVTMLKAFSAPLPQAIFCPTGGISMSNAKDYLALSNVACVGGSWMVNKSLVDNQQWQDVMALARLAAGLRTTL